LHTVDHEKILVVEGIDQYEVIQYLQMIGLAEEGRVVIAKRYGDDKDV
ncbi:6959_t:CDS:2, partial [Entrophospora sp. SA101]